MHTKLLSGAVHGIEGLLVEVEADISQGMPCFSIVGLGDAAVQEAKERVRSAIKNSGGDFPVMRKTINLAPADVKKYGPAFDVPMAVGILRASGQVPIVEKEEAIYIGELALNGDVRPVNGVLLMAMMAKNNGVKKIFVPADNLREALIVDGVEVFPMESLRDLIQHLRGENLIQQNEGGLFEEMRANEFADYPDMQTVFGHEDAKQALMIAAAGRHNVLFSGPPGSGKTCLAQAFRGILPVMSQVESLDLSRVYSVAGLLSQQRPLMTVRPFRSVHHTASAAALIGGGRKALPGEISLAHHGVLFLDELAEFPGYVLETLRQPLEQKSITISRVSGSYHYPANFILLAAMNPCPCGHLGDEFKECVCTLTQIQRYNSKISGPLKDRFDLFVELPRLKYQQLKGDGSGISSMAMRKRINEVRQIQERRFQGLFQPRYNGDMSSKEVKDFCVLAPGCGELMRRAVDVMQLSTRGYFRTLKVARTIADFDCSEVIRAEHINQALHYRLLI